VRKGQTRRRTDSWAGTGVSWLFSVAERHGSRILPFVPPLLASAAFFVYVLTMAPRLTWEHAGRDGGDFITAAWYLGVPHPTGYPTYTILAWLFTRLPFGGVAWRVHLLSGLAGAGTVALTYAIGRKVAAERDSGATVLGGAVGALLLAFAPLFWGHSLVAEVYTLLLFFIALVFWLMLRWRDGASPLWLAALVFGVGMGNHITLMFAAPLILLLMWDGRDRLSVRAVLASFVALAVGLLVYLYLPWRAATDPIINWGDPETWDGFKWMVTGRGYQRFFFALPLEKLGPRLEEWWNLSIEQFPFLAWPLALIGLWHLFRRDRWVLWGTVLHVAICLIYSIGYNTTDAFVNLLPVYFYVALWMGQGAAWLLVEGGQLREPRRRLSLVSRLIIAGALLLPLISLVGKWGEMDLTHERRAETFALGALNAVDPGSVIIVGADAYTFALWYYRYVEMVRPDVVPVNYAMLNFDWYQRTVASHHPDVGLPDVDASPIKLAAVQANLGKRPVFITEDEGDLPGLELTPVGEIWRVTSP
jgi:4-amino-4-deoxy-L-arabinose transferase-like glycosyltransferase